MTSIDQLKTSLEQFDKAQQLFEEKKYDDALIIYEEIMPIFKKTQQWEKYLESVVRIAKIRLDTFTYQNMMPILTEAEVIMDQQTVVKPELALSLYNRIAQTRFYINRHATAICIQYLEKGLARYESILGIHHAIIIEIYYNLSLIGTKLTDRHAQHRYLAQFYKILQQAPEQYKHYLPGLHVLYFFFYRRQNSRKALQHLKKAMAVSTGMNNLKIGFFIKLYVSFGMFYSSINSYYLAIQYYQKALTCFKNHPKKDNNLAYVHMNMGGIYGNLKALKKAQYHMEKALQIAKEIDTNKNNIQIYYIYTTWAQVYTESGEQHKATELYHKVLQHLKKRNNNVDTLFLLSQVCTGLGEIYKTQENYQQAFNYFQQALTVDRNNYGKKSNYVADAHHNIALLYNNQQQYEQAFKQLQKAINACTIQYKEQNIYTNPITEDTISYQHLYTYLLAKANCLIKIYHSETSNLQKLTMALFTYQVCSLLKQKISNYFDTKSSELTFSEQVSQLYLQGLQNAIAAAKVAQQNPEAFKQATQQIAQWNEQTYPKEQFSYAFTNDDCKHLAFEYCEKSKGQVLANNLSHNQAKVQANIPQNILDEEYNLQAEINYLQQEIKQIELHFFQQKDNQKLEEQLAELYHEFQIAEQKYRDLLEQLEKNYPQYHQIKHNHKIVTVVELQNQLQTQQALLNYFIGEKHIYIFTITKKSFDIYTIDKPKDFDKLIQKLHKMLRQIRFVKYTQIAYNLYQLLLAPAQEQLNEQAINDLIIIPHEELHQLPFECLLTNNAETIKVGSFNQLPYLIQQYNISYHYSASLLYQNIHLPHDLIHSDSFVGFAPVYADTVVDTQDAPQSSSPHSNNSKALPKDAMRSVLIGDNEFAELIYSEKEVNVIQQLFEQQNIPTQTYLHEKASLKQFKTAIKNQKYIHIAAHGYEEAKNTDAVGIVLSPNKTTDSDTKTSILFLNDSYTLQLNADLVVLSCCKSGIGTIAKGEGMLAMNRGFLYAGARNVIYTLFKVYDKSSSQLTQHFFQQHLQEQQSYSEALRQAKLQMIAQEEYSPVHWAGFVLIGL